MTATDKMYGRWGNYIPADIRKQFESDCLEAEKELKHPEKAHYRKFSQRQQVLIKMACAMKIRHFKKKETVSLFGIEKSQKTVDEFQEIITGLTRT